jgi:hypothetical protein
MAPLGLLSKGEKAEIVEIKSFHYHPSFLSFGITI